jgi:hypothetical protein
MNKKQAIAKINETDSSLSLLRENWMSAKGRKKGQYMILLNKLLEERFDLMQIRDGKTKVNAG